MPNPRRLLPLALAAALGLVACSSPGFSADPGRSAPPGEVFPALRDHEIVGDVVTVQLPGQTYEIEVGRPQGAADSVSADEAGINPDASEDVRFVAVAWRPKSTEGDAIALGAQGPEISPNLALVAGDETYAVSALDEEGHDASWVAVPADAAPIGFAVEFDGVTQTVEDTTDRFATPEGASDLLYAEPPPGLHDPECPAPEEGPEPARYVFGSCSVTISDPFPYHEALGWAERGTAWVAAVIGVDPVVVGWDEPGPGGAIVDYEVAPEDVEVTLDGRGPTDILAIDPSEPAGLQADGFWRGKVVFPVSADTTDFELAFARPYTGLPEDPDEAVAEGTPAELTGTYAASFPITVG